MSESEESFSWYDPDDVRATVADGKKNNIGTGRIAGYLAEREFDDIPPSRVQRIVERISAAENDSTTDIDLTQPGATDAAPRDSVTKRLAVGDFEYVSNREAARLLGLALEQFDGNTVRPPGATQVETDLVWHRQHMTVAFRIVPTPSGTVDTSHVNALLDGTVVPDDIRSPSKLAIVTNRAFTDEALDLASEHDIHCFDAGHVEEWLRRARIPMDAVGTVLEDGESHDGPLTDLVELPPIPKPRKSADPLEINRAFDIESLTTHAEEGDPPVTDGPTGGDRGQEGTGPGRATARDDPLGGTQSPSGETGTLYADPDEDGDFDAFDRFVDDIKDDKQQSKSADDESTETGSETSSSSDDGDTETGSGTSGSSDDEDTKRGSKISSSSAYEVAGTASEISNSSGDEDTEVTEASSSSDEEFVTYANTDRKELVFDLLDAKKNADELMSWKDVRTHGSYPVEYYQKEFGSLANALDTVGIDYTGELE